MSVEVSEIKEALEQIALKEPYFFNRIIRLSLENIPTKDDLKLLVELINNRFEDMNKRFEDMQKYMENRFEDMNKRFEDMQKYMEKRFEDINKRFESIEKRFSFITQLIVGFNVPLLVSMIGLLLKLIFTK